MKLSDVLLIAGIALIVVGVVGVWLQKRHPMKQKQSDSVIENVADLKDRFNRARYEKDDGK